MEQAIILGNDAVTAMNPVTNIITLNAMFSPECNVFKLRRENINKYGSCLVVSPP
jgi:hypothetical protein